MKISRFIKPLLVVFCLAINSNSARGEDVVFGFFGSFSGSAKPLAQSMADAMQLAMREVNNKGGIDGGKTAVLVSMNSGCRSKDRAIKAVERLIGVESAVSIVGGLCSGATLAAAQGFTIPTKTLMISPASVSVALSGLQDDDLVFRTIKSATSHKNLLSSLVNETYYRNISVVYAGTKQGKSRFDAIKAAYESSETIVVAGVELVDKQEDLSELLFSQIAGKSDVVAFLPDGMLDKQRHDTLLEILELDFVRQVIIDHSEFDAKHIQSLPALNSRKLKMLLKGKPEKTDFRGMFQEMLENAGLNPKIPLLAQTYDAAFLLALAHEKFLSGDDDSPAQSLRFVANAPGVVIGPQDWDRAKKLISEGKDIDYEGASGTIEFDENGDLKESLRHGVIRDGRLVDIDLIN